MMAVRPVIASNWVPYFQMRSVGRTTRQGGEGRKEQDRIIVLGNQSFSKLLIVEHTLPPALVSSSTCPSLNKKFNNETKVTYSRAMLFGNFMEWCHGEEAGAEGQNSLMWDNTWIIFHKQYKSARCHIRNRTVTILLFMDSLSFVVTTHVNKATPVLWPECPYKLLH